MVHLYLNCNISFFRGEVLHLSGGLESIGQIQWHLALCFLAAWVMVYLCLVKGVKTVGKVHVLTCMYIKVIPLCTYTEKCCFKMRKCLTIL